MRNLWLAREMDFLNRAIERGVGEFWIIANWKALVKTPRSKQEIRQQVTMCRYHMAKGKQLKGV